MQFNRVYYMVEKSLTISSPALVYEHEVPILQAVNGIGKVTEIKDNQNRCGPVRDESGDIIDFDLAAEWDRLMHRPQMVSIDEGQKAKAPIVAFPRGALDLEDFYARLRKPHASDKPSPSPVVIAGPDGRTSAKELRATTKKRLDDLGVDYRGNASTDDLVAMFNEIDSDASIQNEG